MVLTVLALLLFQDVAPPVARPPNILLAIADDLDPDHLGFCGNSLARTPALDDLAREGAFFPVLYVQPVCRSSHATLLSGRWPHETGILNNRVGRRLEPAGVLPRRLQERGYATYCAGKLWEGNPADYGFDGPQRNNKNFARAATPGQADVFRFLEEHARKDPWFLWWAPNLPHLPHDPPARFREAFAQIPVPVPAGFSGDPEQYVEDERACLAMEAWFDERFGELIAKLRELGELDNTVVVFLSDNGWSTAELAKGSPREKGIRSPLVVAPPGQACAGMRLDALVSLPDIHATVLDYAGAAPAPDGRGRSLRPLLEGGTYEPRERLYGSVYLRSERDGDEGELAALYARDGRWKTVFYVRDVGPAGLSASSHLAPSLVRRAGAQELFDLAEDPLERHDLAGRAEHAERLGALRAGAIAWWLESGGAALPLK